MKPRLLHVSEFVLGLVWGGIGLVVVMTFWLLGALVPSPHQVRTYSGEVIGGVEVWRGSKSSWAALTIRSEGQFVRGRIDQYGAFRGSGLFLLKSGDRISMSLADIPITGRAFAGDRDIVWSVVKDGSALLTFEQVASARKAAMENVAGLFALLTLGPGVLLIAWGIFKYRRAQSAAATASPSAS